MNTIKAIETRYAGYRFRSRLEARWAVFFDSLGLEWEYEPEGIETDAGWYLPDFRVMTPQGKPIWYEVKPKGVKGDAKFQAFAKELVLKTKTFPRFRLLKGDPIDCKVSRHVCPRCCMFSSSIEETGDGDEDTWTFGCCFCVSELGDEPHGNHYDDVRFAEGFAGTNTSITFNYVEISRREMAHVLWPIMTAEKRARSARFEHGERP